MEPRTEYNQEDITGKSLVDTIGGGATGTILDPHDFKRFDHFIPEVTDTPTEKEDGTDVKEKTTLGIVAIIVIAFVGYMVVRFFLNRRK